MALISKDLNGTTHQIQTLQEISAIIESKISFEKTEITPTFKQKLQALQLNNGNKIKTVQKLKYLCKIITWNLNEKPSIESHVTKLKQAERITCTTYKNKSLSIITKIRYYNSVANSETTCETLFKLNIKSNIQFKMYFQLNIQFQLIISDKLKKIDKKY